MRPWTEAMLYVAQKYALSSAVQVRSHLHLPPTGDHVPNTLTFLASPPLKFCIPGPSMRHARWVAALLALVELVPALFHRQWKADVHQSLRLFPAGSFHTAKVTRSPVSILASTMLGRSSQWRRGRAWDCRGNICSDSVGCHRMVLDGRTARAASAPAQQIHLAATAATAALNLRSS